MATKAKGSLETRPWLPDGYSLGFTSSQTEKRDYPDADERPDDERQYEARVGRVVVVDHRADESIDLGAFDSEADAQTWAKDQPASFWKGP